MCLLLPPSVPPFPFLFLFPPSFLGRQITLPKLTNRVCSNWAERCPSAVTEVQLSGHVRSCSRQRRKDVSPAPAMTGRKAGRQVGVAREGGRVRDLKQSGLAGCGTTKKSEAMPQARSERREGGEERGTDTACWCRSAQPFPKNAASLNHPRTTLLC